MIGETLAAIPPRSEYRAIGDFALEVCRRHDSWERAWPIMEKRLERYHWIHAYPNLAAELMALWYGEGDFDKTANIIAMAGQDVDCTAAPVLNAVAVMNGGVPDRWTAPLGDHIKTFMRARRTILIEDLVDETATAIRNAVAAYES